MYLPEDVVNEILVRLPVKCLLKFRCVCKAWLALIGSPGFIDFHLNHPSQKDYDYLLLLDPCKNKDKDPVLSFYSRGLDRSIAPDFPAFDEPMNAICGPCNGIVCVMFLCYISSSCSPGCHGYDPNTEAIYLVNPATRESRKLPDRPLGVPSFLVPYFSKRIVYGFGFDSCNNEYKVVSVMTFKTPQGWMHMIEIYELRSNSWRVAADTPIPPTWGGDSYDPDFCHECGLFLHGWLHWTASRVMIGFDVSNEVLVEISYPEDSISDDALTWIPGVLEDCLALVVAEIPESSTIVIWVMREYGVKESWTKRYRLGSFPRFIYPLVCPCWNDDILLAQDMNDDRKLLSLHLDHVHHDHQLKAHNIYNDGSMFGAIIMHKETLVSVRSMIM